MRRLGGGGCHANQRDEALGTLQVKHRDLGERLVQASDLCHGPLGAVLALALCDRPMAPPATFTADWYEHEYQTAEPGLMSGKAGVAHTLAVVLASADATSRPETLLAIFD